MVTASLLALSEEVFGIKKRMTFDVKPFLF